MTLTYTQKLAIVENYKLSKQKLMLEKNFWSKHLFISSLAEIVTICFLSLSFNGFENIKEHYFESCLVVLTLSYMLASGYYHMIAISKLLKLEKQMLEIMRENP